MNAEDSKIAAAVESSLEDVASVIDLIAERVKENGRVIYFGAGTSGRYLLNTTFQSHTLILLSGSECWMPRKCERQPLTKAPQFYAYRMC
jgi:hypothetical protein